MAFLGYRETPGAKFSFMATGASYKSPRGAERKMVPFFFQCKKKICWPNTL